MTTEEARLGGVEIYGYPKFVADIDLKKAGDAFRCCVRAEEERIVTLQVSTLPTQLLSWEGLDLHPQGWAACEDVDPVSGTAWV